MLAFPLDFSYNIVVLYNLTVSGLLFLGWLKISDSTMIALKVTWAAVTSSLIPWWIPGGGLGVHTGFVLHSCILLMFIQHHYIPASGWGTEEIVTNKKIEPDTCFLPFPLAAWTGFPGLTAVHPAAWIFCAVPLSQPEWFCWHLLLSTLSLLHVWTKHLESRELPSPGAQPWSWTSPVS